MNINIFSILFFIYYLLKSLRFIVVVVVVVVPFSHIPTLPPGQGTTIYTHILIIKNDVAILFIYFCMIR